MLLRILTLLALTVTMSESSLASIHIGLSGSTSSSHFSLESHKRSSVSASFAVGVARFLRIGLTHRRSFEKKKGLKKNQISETQFIYYEFQDDTEVITSSIDLTAVLYQGPISPFIFGGAARRDYYSEVIYPGNINKTSVTNDIVPNYGLGVSIYLSREFSLKITQTYTAGEKKQLTADGTEKKVKTTDSYTQLGITYRLP